MSNHINMYKGYIGHRRQDGSMEMGDSAVWTGHFQYLNDGLYPKSITDFEVAFGSYVRFPDPNMTDFGFGAYYKNPYNGCMSRDQLTGILSALIAEGNTKASLRFIAHHALRGFLFAYNTIHNGVKPETAKWKMPDLTLFDFWAMEIRSLGVFAWLLWPLLCVFDLHMLLNTIYFNFFDKDGDQINFAIKHFAGVEHTPTIVSWFAWKICNKDKLIDLLKEYWGKYRNQPGMFNLYSDKVHRL